MPASSRQRENAEAPRFAGYRSVLASNVVWRLVAVCFLIQVGFYGLTLWLPHLVKTTIGGSDLRTGLVTAIPYLVAIAGLWLNARSANRNGRYSVHVLASMVLGAVALVASVALGHHASGGSFLSTSLVLAAALLTAGLLTLTLRRRADQPLTGPSSETAAVVH